VIVVDRKSPLAIYARRAAGGSVEACPGGDTRQLNVAADRRAERRRPVLTGGASMGSAQSCRRRTRESVQWLATRCDGDVAWLS